jgi:putative endonuclease
LEPKDKAQWHLYVVVCSDGSYYTGIAKDVDKRIQTHNSGRGSKYTASHGPVRLVYQEPQRDYSQALRREFQIKTLSKSRKERLILGEALAAPLAKAKMSFQRHQKRKVKAPFPSPDPISPKGRIRRKPKRRIRKPPG